MDIPSHLKYTAEHEWLEIEGNIVTIGITDFAQSSLGDVVFVELPEEGAEVSKGDHFAVVESVKAASEVYTPVSGKVVEINTDLVDAPDMVNSNPFGDAWFVKIQMSDTEELEDALDASAYEAYVEGIQ